MDDATVSALNQLNRGFYAAIAREWSQTRNSPWDGFTRVLAQLPATAEAAQPTRVLDVGAGDGRFAAWLAGSALHGIEYTGVDLCHELLDYARARALGPHYRFLELDFVATDPEQSLPPGPQQLIALFGVLHHVPSLALRKRLLRALARRLAPQGVLAMTFWRLPDDARFTRRVLPWPTYNAHAQAPITLAQLEEGDTLLRWGSGAAPPRYCHFACAAEVTELIACTELDLLDRFRADGRAAQLNEYVLLTARAPLSSSTRRC